MRAKSLLPCLFLSSVLVATACTSRPPNLPQSTSTAVANTPTIAPTISVATKTLIPSNTIASTTPTPSFQYLEIESGDPRSVSKAVWSDDEKSIYYAFARSDGSKSLQWAAYDMTTHLTTTISSPLKYDPSIWKRLNVPDPDPNGEYTELQGFVSPSGKYAVYGVYHNLCYPISACIPNAPPDEVWIGDVTTRLKKRAGTLPCGGGIDQAIWFDHEKKIALNVSGEATTSSCIVDLQTGVIKSLGQIANIRVIESIWSTDVSPDSNTVAAINTDELWLITLASGKAVKVDSGVTYAHWSKDGQMIYYDTVGKPTDEIRVYSIASGITSTLLSEPYLTGTIGNDFAISISGDKIVFWGGRLRLIDLKK